MRTGITTRRWASTPTNTTETVIRLIGGGTLGVLGLALVALTVLGPTRSDEAVAYVNGEAITRSEYDEYALVLSGNGVREVAPVVVVQSLVNQRLALNEAHAAGFSVTDEELELAVEGVQSDGVDIDMVKGAGGLEAFRERLRVWMLFEWVKRRVTKDVGVTDDQIRQYVEDHRPLYDDRDWAAVKAEVEPAVLQLHVDRYWADWLAAKRACADIDVAIPNINLPSLPTATGC